MEKKLMHIVLTKIIVPNYQQKELIHYIIDIYFNNELIHSYFDSSFKNETIQTALTLVADKTGINGIFQKKMIRELENKNKVSIEIISNNTNIYEYDYSNFKYKLVNI